MPTYTFRCDKCGAITSAVMSIRAYCAAPPVFVHCGVPSERFFEVVPGLAINNALASERHYDGLRATDGADISTRAKHRAYMRERNLTTVDDFTQTWKREAEARAARIAGHDPSRAADVAQAIAKLGG
jgi:hypothetical protein